MVNSEQVLNEETMAQTRAEVSRLVQTRAFTQLRETLSNYPPPQLAELLGVLPLEAQVIAFRVLPRELEADVFEYLPLPEQKQLLKALAHW